MVHVNDTKPTIIPSVVRVGDTDLVDDISLFSRAFDRAEYESTGSSSSGTQGGGVGVGNSIILYVGPSRTKSKQVRLPYSNMMVSPKPQNAIRNRWDESISFKTEIKDKILTVTRKDNVKGWGMELQLRSFYRKDYMHTRHNEFNAVMKAEGSAVTIELRHKQKLICKRNAFIFKQEDVKMTNPFVGCEAKNTVSGLFKGTMRNISKSFSGDESDSMSEYTYLGKKGTNAIVTFGGQFPCKILHLQLGQFGNKIIFREGTLLASSADVKMVDTDLGSFQCLIGYGDAFFKTGPAWKEIVLTENDSFSVQEKCLIAFTQNIHSQTENMYKFKGVTFEKSATRTVKGPGIVWLNYRHTNARRRDNKVARDVGVKDDEMMIKEIGLESNDLGLSYDDTSILSEDTEIKLMEESKQQPKIRDIIKPVDSLGSDLDSGDDLGVEIFGEGGIDLISEVKNKTSNIESIFEDYLKRKQEDENRNSCDTASLLGSIAEADEDASEDSDDDSEMNVNDMTHSTDGSLADIQVNVNIERKKNEADILKARMLLQRAKISSKIVLEGSRSSSSDDKSTGAGKDIVIELLKEVENDDEDIAVDGDAESVTNILNEDQNDSNKSATGTNADSSGDAVAGVDIDLFNKVQNDSNNTDTDSAADKGISTSLLKKEQINSNDADVPVSNTVGGSSLVEVAIDGNGFENEFGIDDYESENDGAAMLANAAATTNNNINRSMSMSPHVLATKSVDSVLGLQVLNDVVNTRSEDEDTYNSFDDVYLRPGVDVETRERDLGLITNDVNNRSTPTHMQMR